jgi:signal transduction histidine kinase
MIPAPRVERKWRPRLGLVVFAVFAAVLALPLAGVFFFRIYENQLIHETESELIAQSVMLAAVVAHELDASPPPGEELGPAVAPPATEGGRYAPLAPKLDLAGDAVLPRRPDAEPAPRPAAADYVELGARLAPIMIETQRETLAGFRLLDPRGVVIGGREETGLSLAHVPEVAEALQGRFASVLRLRVSKHEPPPLYSASRGTGLRIFVAHPVLWRGRVAGVVYVSRTPSNVFKHLYDERSKVALASLAVLLLAAGLGYVFHRTITHPVHALIARTNAMARGDRDALKPLDRHGTEEFAQLAQSFLDMAAGLAHRSDVVATFAAHVSHELKSPLTSIKGAAELLRDDVGAAEPMTDETKRRFLDNIARDAERLSQLVNRLREMARAEQSPLGGRVRLATILAHLKTAFPQLDIRRRQADDPTLAMSEENARIVFVHLADNALRHGAKRLDIEVSRDGESIDVLLRDDGAGVSPANRTRIFDHFFTTRRESGGAGMGLTIVRAMLRAHGGDIVLADSEKGAAFLVTIPAPFGKLA